MTFIANARMYAVTPAVAAAWRALFARVAETSGVALTYIDHAAPAPLEDLWSRDDLGAAFMCGFVVRAEAPFRTLTDTFGGRIGWTVHHSQSGYNAVRYHLLRYARERAEPLYAERIGPLVTPRAVVEAVLFGRIDVGPLDSYVHDLLGRHDPATASRLRTVASTAMTPIPALVASPQVPAETADRLRAALIACGGDRALRPVLETLALTGFSAVAPAAYAALLEQARAAESLRAP
jgi:ABC-type phosphate/phosphonate transport system substrate-binding protein